MKIKNPKIEDFDLAVYRIYWNSGGSSVASVYQTWDRVLMLAPSNWVAPHPLKKCLEKGDIKKIKKLGSKKS